jgi:chromosomal replication initiator protein
VDAQEAWQVAFHQLELQLDRASFDTWLRGAAFMDVEDDVFVIGVRNAYARDMLQHRLYRNVRRVLCDVCGKSVELRFEVLHAMSPAPNAESDMPLFRLLAQQDEEDVDAGIPFYQKVSRPQLTPLPESELNPRFTFDRFIVNGSNRITYEAARAVAENPARSYNPLMIYGGVGLGKTHLLQAIAHECIARDLRVIYIPSEAFTNDLVDSIRRKSTAMFREKYRSADVLLVDDVQFIAGKDSTQEEFFHTFNALYTFNKQIIIASDRHPRDLNGLDDRLVSRFEGGLVTDIQALEFESRLAILNMWVQERQLDIDSTVLWMIGERAEGNVRELEGVFNQIVAQSRLGRGQLSIENAEDTLDRFERPRQHTSAQREISVKNIIELTAKYFQLRSSDLTGKHRSGRINLARQVAMFLCRELTDCSLPQIGEIFGGRKHTTILHGCNKIVDDMEFDDSLRQRIYDIRAALGAD